LLNLPTTTATGEKAAHSIWNTIYLRVSAESGLCYLLSFGLTFDLLVSVGYLTPFKHCKGCYSLPHR